MNNSNKNIINDNVIYPMKVLTEDKNKDISHRSYAPEGVLLKPPFNLIAYGSSQSGKSNCIASILTRVGKNGSFYGEDQKGKVFDDIIIISSTMASDDCMIILKEMASEMHDTYNDNIVKDIVSLQRERQDRGERKRVLILMDDIITMCKPNDYIFRAMTNARHDNISIMVCIQNVRGTLPPVARANAHQILAFRLHSEKERKKLFEELSYLDTEKEIAHMYNHCTREPYNFMFVDAKHLKVYHNFTTPLWQRYNPDGTYSTSFSGKKSKMVEIQEIGNELNSDSE